MPERQHAVLHDTATADSPWWSPAEWTVTPGRITLAYVTLALFALYLSDVFLVGRVENMALLHRVQTLAGVVQVTLTAAVIYFLSVQSQRSFVRQTTLLETYREQLGVLQRVLRHNLRNDMNVITGWAETLRDALSECEHRARCERILDASEDVLDYVDHAKRISEVTAPGHSPVTVDLAAVVPRVVDDHPLVTDALDVTTSLPEEAVVETTPLVEDVLSELVTNAVVHDDSGEPGVEIRVTDSGGPREYATLEVEDDGPGIPAEERETLARRTETPLRHMSGMGLWFCHWATVTTGGEFEVADAPGGGSVVTLSLRPDEPASAFDGPIAEFLA